MPEIALDADEKRRVEVVANELDLEIDELFCDARDSLTREQWQLLVTYSRACVRRVLEVGVLLHSVVDAQSRRIEYPGRGRDVFVRGALAVWRDSFAPVPDVWELGPVFAAVPGGEQRAVAEIATLEVMAANRMFESLDDQCATFLA